MKFVGSKKLLAHVEYLKMLVALAVAENMKINKKKKRRKMNLTCRTVWINLLSK